MDPLAALRLAASPELRSQALGKDGLDAFTKAIPKAELEKLTAGRLGPGTLGLNPADGTSIARTESGSGSFESTLNQFVAGVNAKQAIGNDAVSGLLSGQNGSLHQTMIAMEEASVSFQLMVEVRNKLLESYQELMRMQV